MLWDDDASGSATSIGTGTCEDIVNHPQPVIPRESKWAVVREAGRPRAGETSRESMRAVRAIQDGQKHLTGHTGREIG
jgi:hypothetical protein